MIYLESDSGLFSIFSLYNFETFNINDLKHLQTNTMKINCSRRVLDIKM